MSLNTVRTFLAQDVENRREEVLRLDDDVTSAPIFFAVSIGESNKERDMCFLLTDGLSFTKSTAFTDICAVVAR